jgi:hypothetical protein
MNGRLFWWLPQVLDEALQQMYAAQVETYVRLFIGFRF